MRLGIDIGGTKTAVAAVSTDGSVIAQRSAPSGRGPLEVTRVAALLARETVALAGIPADAVGACMPGMVDPDTGVVRHAVNLDVDELDLAGGLRHALDLPVSVDNDVKAAALGAALHVGSSGGVNTLVYLNLGTGLAAAVVRDGRVLRGPDGAVGEIGHMPVGGLAPCQCGQIGCLETLASGSGVARLWRPESGQSADPFVAAAEGNPHAAKAAAMLADGVAQALQMLAVTCGPDRVVIGGGVSRAQGLGEAIKAAIEAREASSDFVASMHLASRFEILPPDLPIASLGASLLPTR